MYRSPHEISGFQFVVNGASVDTVYGGVADEYDDFIGTYERIHEKLDELCKSIKPDSANQPDVLSRLSKFITTL